MVKKQQKWCKMLQKNNKIRLKFIDFRDLPKISMFLLANLRQLAYTEDSIMLRDLKKVVITREQGKKGEIVVACDDETVIGWSSIFNWCIEPHRADNTMYLFVDSKYRRKGLGTILVNKLLKSTNFEGKIFVYTDIISGRDKFFTSLEEERLVWTDNP